MSATAVISTIAKRMTTAAKRARALSRLGLAACDKLVKGLVN
jgi:hypothetical protein